MKVSRSKSGFTIVELLIVIVIIGILATIVIVAYNGITTKARQVTLQSDLTNSRTKIELANATYGQYPMVSTVSANKANYLAESKGNTLTYNTNSNQDTYCISAIGPDNITYVVSNLTGPVKGSCTGTDSEVATEGDGIPAPPAQYIQTVTTATCPSTRTRVQDARDNRTYWVKKIGSLCWMMTNLAYAGGGTNTYSDVMPIGNGSSGTLNGPDNSGSLTDTLAKYYIPTGSNVTTEPTNPSTSADGAGQYGYLYNWCAAMKGQATAACANATAPAPITTTTICPSGWRLPSGSPAEFGSINTVVNSGSTTSDTGLIGSEWLGQRGGAWAGAFYYQGENGGYWYSSQYSAPYAYVLIFSSSSVNVLDYAGKDSGRAVRCVAAV